MDNICPTCGHKMVQYRFKLDDIDISCLLKIHQYVVEYGNYEVDVKQAGLTYSERSRVTQLRFHGLLAKAMAANGRHKAATWILTRRAAQFLKGMITIPEYVITSNNRVIGHHGKQVSRRDYRVLDDFSTNWDYVELDPERGWVTINTRAQQTLL